MSQPAHNSSPENILSPARIFFATTKTGMGRNLIQSDRNAELLVSVLHSLVSEKQLELHDFVIMPDHLHLLLTVKEGMTIEKAMQMIKGRFSYRLSHELGYKGEVWQRGYSEVQVMNRTNFEKCHAYIAQNPVKAGLVKSPEEYLYCFRSLAARKQEQELKPQ